MKILGNKDSKEIEFNKMNKYNYFELVFIGSVILNDLTNTLYNF